jgi:hypothetical protein
MPRRGVSARRCIHASCPASFIDFTRQAPDRMGIAAVENILSVLDGKPTRDNVVNRKRSK